MPVLDDFGQIVAFSRAARLEDHAFGVIAEWIDHYHGQRPHQALGYVKPYEYREKRAA